jgi:tetratricopeptide (TPR) repeat protein
MSTLSIDSWRLPAAPLGAENPLPPFSPPTHQPVLSDKPDTDPTAGYLPDYLPYMMQDGYTRQRTPTDLKVAVLENDILRATFLLEYGGRLWSLVHKLSGRELLYVNPIFQPGNLAMRNAWFSGGVEWNMGVIAHTPFTVSPLFAARLAMPDGTPILRLYEWERIRQAAYQIDAYLPDGSKVLYVRVRLVNPHDHPMPMYWWSNIAVPEREDVRVIAPASSAYQYALSVSDLSTVAMPVVNGVDVSYTTNGTRAADYFFLIPETQRPWITALDSEGTGLVHVSTDLLHGRKLFLWGTGSGGKRWQEWLSGSDATYLEIQAGLAPTQLEYALMPPRAEFEWLEAYGLMQADAQTAHGADWNAARADVESRIEQIVPRAAFDAELRRGDAWKDLPPAEILHRGSGWGMLETLRRQTAGELPFAGAALDFSESLTSQQQPWVELLQTGTFLDSTASSPQAGTLVQPEWKALLETAVQNHPDSGWEVWLHLGTMRLHAGDAASALQAWQTSLERQRTAWALRNLAVLARQQNQFAQAADLYAEAQTLQPNLLPLLIETARALIDASRSADFLTLVDASDEAIRSNGRIHLLELEAGLATGDLDRVGALLTDGFEIVDYREGDEILTELWFRYHAMRVGRAGNLPVDDALMRRVRQEYPLPALFDFRMNVQENN